MATLLELKQGILRRLAWADDKVGLLPIPLTATTTAADKASLRDTALARGTHSLGNYNGRHVEIVETVTGSPTLGSVAAVDDGGFDLTDKLALSPDFDDEVQAGTDYLMYPRLLVPETLADAINGVLTKVEARCFFPLSLHIVGNDCNDMEASTVATDYSKSLNVTLAAETTRVYNGSQSMKVTASGGDAQYAYVGFNINETQSLYAAVLCSVTTGDSATFRIYDSGAVTIIEDATSEERAWVELVIPFTVPSGCKRVQVMFMSDADGDITYWDDFQIWYNGRGVYPLPSWITRRSQLLDIRAFPQGAGGPASDNDYRVNERGSIGLNWEVDREDARANNPLHITVRGLGAARPYIYAMRPFAELSALTDTTNCDEDYVVAKAAAQILKNRGDEGWWALDREAQDRARALGYGGRQLRGKAPTVLV